MSNTHNGSGLGHPFDGAESAIKRAIKYSADTPLLGKLQEILAELKKVTREQAGEALAHHFIDKLSSLKSRNDDKNSKESNKHIAEAIRLLGIARS